MNQSLLILFLVASGTMSTVAMAQSSSHGDDPVTVLLQRIDHDKITPVPLKNTLDCKQSIEKMRQTVVFDHKGSQSPNLKDGMLIGGTVGGMMALINAVRSINMEQRNRKALLTALKAAKQAGRVPDEVLRHDLSVLERNWGGSFEVMKEQVKTAARYVYKDPKLARLVSKMDGTLTEAIAREASVRALDQGFTWDASKETLESASKALTAEMEKAAASLSEFEGLQQEFIDTLVSVTSKEAVEATAVDAGSAALRYGTILKFLGRAAEGIIGGTVGGVMFQWITSPQSTDSCDTLSCQASTDRSLYNSSKSAAEICAMAFTSSGSGLKREIEYKSTLVGAIDSKMNNAPTPNGQGNDASAH